MPVPEPPAAATPAGDELLRARYREADLDTRVRHSIAGCWLAMVLMPGGALLDWFAYPDRLAWLGLLRVLCDLAIVPVLLLLRTPFGRRQVRLLGLAWAQLPSLAICVMIGSTDGAASPYFLGLVLVMIAVTQLMPWTLAEVVANCLLTLAGYTLACVLHPGPLAGSALGLNLTFLVEIAAVCGTAGWFSARRRFDDFALRCRIDEQKRELEENYRSLAEADRLRSQFVANISHELRTPLTLIIGPLEDLLASGARLERKVAEGLGLARDNGLRLLRLINDLLEIGRIEAGGGALQRRPLDLAVFVPGLGEQLRYLAENKELALSCSGPAEPLVVAADPARLEKVLLNLLTNAIKFTPPGGSIAVTWERRDGQARCAVRDTGPGIPAHEHARIFDRFHQVDGSSTRHYQGVGLGLALVRDLVQEHGGHIELVSAPGQGSTFTVVLPLAADGQAGTASAPRDRLERIHHQAELRGALPVTEPAADGGILGADGPLVLVVEDEPDMRRFLVGLVREGRRVAQAADGPAAVALATRLRPDLILLDMMLPGMDGLEVAQRLRADPALAATRVVMLTARCDGQTRLKALGLGVDDFLTKPFSADEVRLRIGNLLRLGELQAGLAARNQELAAALERLKSAEAQLVQSEKMGALGRMSAGLMHEINNPLNFTLTAVEVARQEAAGQPGLGETLADIRTGLERIRTVVTDLKVFAHPSQGRDARPFAVADPVELAARLCARELDGITLERDLAAAPLVEGSCNQLSHVFVNLIGNAVCAIRERPGPGTIRISARPAGTRVQVVVRDDGIGIPPEHLPRLCEPFFTTRPPGKGLGLGLSICNALVSAHGGRLAASSEPGRWTEFSFDLPAAGSTMGAGTDTPSTASEARP
ncbi:MAG: ATP-binding protein [Planctomycetes bacterium]|nr:ATP-binding protein [Planctomycetota bacterium]